MQPRILIAALLLVAATPGVRAQNSDLGVLVGVLFPATEVGVSGMKTSAGASVQINYAYQVYGTPNSSLYVEMPVVIAAGNSARVDRFSVSASSGATIFFTPGVRFKLPLHSRLSLYGAAGGGICAFDGSQVFVVFGGTGGNGRTVSWAADIAGGVDIRLTRLLSLRGEVRDFVTRARLGGVAGRNHVIGQAGIAFHF